MSSFYDLTDEERSAALKRAAEMRSARAELGRKVKRGEVSVEDAMSDELASRVKVTVFCRWVPGVGKRKTEEIMREVGVYEGRRVGGLTDKKRAELLEALKYQAERAPIRPERD